METAPSDKVVDRIRKMLALAGNNPNEHEAESAMRMAHKLLAKYNLSLADVKEKEVSDPYVRNSEYIPAYQGEPAGRQIVGQIARLYFCKMVYTTVRNGQIYHFVGRQTNVAIARDIATVVIKSLRVQSNAGKNVPGYITNFMIAAAHTIYNRVQSMILEASKGEAKNAEGTANLPALRSLYADETKKVEDVIEEILGKPTPAKDKLKGGNGDYGYYEGMQAGKSANLRPTLGSSKKEGLK